MPSKISVNFLNGIRCLCCLWILFLHVVLFSGWIPANDEKIEKIREFPVLGFFATSTLAVDVFWMISGFLCFYQLEYEIDDSKPFWSFWFFMNRLLRLCSLYYVMVFVSYFTDLSPECANFDQFISALLFYETYVFPDTAMNAVCSGPGWTLHIDIAAYIVIILLFQFFNGDGKYSIQKYIYWIWFGVSCIISIIVSNHFNLDWPIGSFTLETYDPKIFENAISQDNGFEIPNIYDEIFTDFNPHSVENIKIREKELNWKHHIYFTSIERHGAVMFLGCILAINLIQRQKKNKKHKKEENWDNSLMVLFLNNILPMFVSLYIVHEMRKDINNHHFIWSALHDKLFGFGIFKFFDLCLYTRVYYDDDNNLFNKMINILFGNPIWNFLNKFTFSFYIFHGIPLMVILFVVGLHPMLPSGVGYENYGFACIFDIFVKVAALTFIVAVIFYYLIEYPVSLFRRKYLHPKYRKDMHRENKQHQH